MMASFNSTRVLLTLFGFCLFVHGVQSGIKSPYRKTDNLASSERGVGPDNSGEERLQQKQEIDELRTNITQLTQSFESFKHVMEHQIHQIHQTVDTQCSRHNHDVHGSDSHSDIRSGSHGHDSHGHDSHGHDSHGHGPHGHGPHGHAGSCGRPNKYPASFMRPPRVRNTDEFDFAICNVKPNSKLPSSNVTGRIVLMQKKNSPTLYLAIRVAGFDVSEHGQDGHDSLVERNHQESDRIQDIGQQRQDFSQQISKMSKNQKIVDDGHNHAIQLHETADLSEGCDSTGGHFNPYNARHGSPDSNIRHVGDFGNIECDDEGATNLIITDETASLRGQYSIIGKPIVIHQTPDDYTTASASSASSGRGGRLACCVIEKIPSTLYNEYDFPGAFKPSRSSADVRQGQGQGQGSGNRGGGRDHQGHSQGQRGQSGSQVHPGGHDTAADSLGGPGEQFVPRPSRTGKNPYSG